VVLDYAALFYAGEKDWLKTALFLVTICCLINNPCDKFAGTDLCADEILLNQLFAFIENCKRLYRKSVSVDILSLQYIDMHN
jgi:hypothetical protein